MVFFTSFLGAIPLGILLTLLIFLSYNHTPEKWLQESGTDLFSPNFQKAVRLHSRSHLFILFLAANFSFFCILLKNEDLPFYIFSSLYLFSGILLSLSDIYNRIIPHQYLLFLFLTGIFEWISGFFRTDDFPALWHTFLWDKLLGALFSFGAFFLFLFVLEHLKKEESLGFGDIKLLTVSGFICGLRAFPLFLFSSFFSAALFSLFFFFLQKPKKRSDEDSTFKIDSIPLAPFICASLFFYLLFEKDILIILYPFSF